MRAREFVIERQQRQQQQLNEFAPLAFMAPVIGTSVASMGLLSLLWYGISGVLTAKELYDTLDGFVETAEVHGYWPPDWPEDEKDELISGIGASIIWALIGAAPKIAQGAGKLMSMAKNAFKETPEAAKKEALEKIAPKIEAELKKISKNKTGTTTTAPTTTTTPTPAPKTTTTQPTTATPKSTSNINQAEKDKQAELKRRLQSNPETPQEKLKRELKAKQSANQNK